MPNYVTTKQIVIPKGTQLVQPAPISKEPVTYAHAVFDANRSEAEGSADILTHFSIPLGAALQDGLIEESQ